MRIIKLLTLAVSFIRLPEIPLDTDTEVLFLNSCAISGSIWIARFWSLVTFSLRSVMRLFTQCWKGVPKIVYTTLPKYSRGSFSISFLGSGSALSASPF